MLDTAVVTSEPSDASFDSLGDRMKSFEGVEAKRRFTQGLPVMVRLDGRSFHTFTKGMARPFYEPMSRCMIETARYLVQESHAAFAYTQSDEITLGFWARPSEGTQAAPQIIFDGRVQKLCSVLAAMATAKFNQLALEHLPEHAHKLPVFDARAFEMPSLEEMANCVLFRALDCKKNAITMAALAHFSHKAISHKNGHEKLKMLQAAGVDWQAYPAFFREGTFLRRELHSRFLSDEELARIPEAKRPSGPVLRSRVTEVVTPPFNELCNPVAFLFHSELPQVKPHGSQ